MQIIKKFFKNNSSIYVLYSFASFLKEFSLVNFKGQLS